MGGRIKINSVYIKTYYYNQAAESILIILTRSFSHFEPRFQIETSQGGKGNNVHKNQIHPGHIYTDISSIHPHLSGSITGTIFIRYVIIFLSPSNFQKSEEHKRGVTFLRSGLNLNSPGLNLIVPAYKK